MDSGLRAALFLAGLGLLGCAETAGYDRTLDTFVGLNISVLIQSWGSPTAVAAVPGGGKRYTWEEGEDSFVYTHRSPYAEGPVHTRWCHTTMTTDEAGVIKAWRWKGNACQRRSPRG